jgi:hypothetical protein
MATPNDAWKVLEHSGIQKLNERLWRVEGALPGMSLRRVMTVAKRNDGRLVVHSAIAMSDSEMAELEAFGEPGFLVVPNHYHRLDAPRYKQRYPRFKVLAPSGVRDKVAERLAVDGSYEDYPADDATQLHTLPGTAEREGAMLVHAADGLTVVLNDVVMNMDKKRDVLGYLFTTLLGSAPGPRVSRLARFGLVKDRKVLRTELERLAALPDLVRLIVSHEKVAEGKEAASALRQAATYL